MENPLESVPRETAAVVGLVSGSQFVNHTYLVLFPPILSVLAEDFAVSLAALGIALGVQGATNTAFQLPFGYLADTRDRTVAFALSSFAGALGVLVVAAAPTYEVLVLGAGLVGVGVAGHHPAHYPLLSDATPSANRGRAFSVYGFGGSLGFATPPVVITAVIGMPGLTWRDALLGFGLLGLLYAALATAYLARRAPDIVTAPTDAGLDAEGNPVGGDVGDGEGPTRTDEADVEEATGDDDAKSLRERVREEAAAMAESPAILALAFLTLLTSTASWGVTTYAVVLLTDAYGVSLEVANLTLTGLFAVGAVAILLGGDLADRTSAGSVLIGSYAAVGLLLAALATGVLPPLGAILCLLAVGAARSAAGPARDGLTDRLSPAGSVGKSFAVISIGVMLGGAVAPPVFGYLITLPGAGVAVAFGAIAVVAVVAAGLTVWVVYRYAR